LDWKRPHEREFKRNIQNTKCVEKKGMKKMSKMHAERLENRSYWKGQKKSKKIQQPSEFTRMWLQGFYTATNLKWTLKKGKEKPLVMEVRKSIWNTRINKGNSNLNWNNNYQVQLSAVIGHHIRSSFCKTGSHCNLAISTLATTDHSDSSRTLPSLILGQIHHLEYRMLACSCLLGLLFFIMHFTV
jgi:hypothetical protein